MIIFGCDVSFSSHKTNRANDIYVLGKDFIQGVNGKTIYAEKMYITDLTEQDKKIVLSLPYNGDNSYLFVNSVEQLKFKTDNNQIKRVPLCLGNVSTRFSVTNIQKQDYMAMFMTLLLIINPLQLKQYMIFTGIYSKKWYCIKYLILFKKNTDISFNIDYKCNSLYFIKKSKV